MSNSLGVRLVTGAAVGAAALAGLVAGGVALIVWLPGLAASVVGAQPKVFWYLSRSSAVAAYGLLWLSMVFGLVLTNRLARLWPGGPTAFDLHQYTSLLGTGLALFHALILIGDGYLQYSLGQLLVPFASAPYRPLWVGLGQVAFYGLGLVSLSFYARQPLGKTTWRVIHAASFALFGLALLHGLLAGTDSGAGLMLLMYWVTGGSVLFLTLYRALFHWGLKTAER